MISTSPTDPGGTAPIPLSERARRGSGCSDAEIASLLAVARQAAEAGAEPLRRMFGKLDGVREKGGAGNLVTEADLAAEAAVLDTLARATPEIPVLSEESGQIGRAHV